MGATGSSSAHRGPPTQGSGGAAPSKLAPGLYLTATPIGNLADITLRAIEVLGAADLIACEDTRVTGKLLARYGITTPRLSYHEHNAARVGPRLLSRLSQGQAVALVSDAGTPLVSDPGYKLVQAAIEAGLPVTTVPGPSAVLAALSLSGLPSDRFMFAGFLSSRAAQRRRALKDLARVEATLVVLESARRLGAALADMAELLGARPAAVARELTKRFEEVRRAPLPELARHYAAHGAPKGEVVIVVAPPAAPVIDEAAAEEMLREALRTMGTAEAAAWVAAESGLPRRLLYGRALKLRGER
jgi:16S rRNA (cytidine1402-2'-O)-methyltransferase